MTALTSIDTMDNYYRLGKITRKDEIIVNTPATIPKINTFKPSSIATGNSTFDTGTNSCEKLELENRNTDLIDVVIKTLMDKSDNEYSE